MNIEPFLIASTIRIVVGQRLVRRLCPECREIYTPKAAELHEIGKVFQLDNAAAFKKIHELEKAALAGGIGANNPSRSNKHDPSQPSTSDKAILHLWKAHEDGCDNCNHTGYKGRMGIYEVLPNTTNIQQLIVSNSTSEKIEAQAIADGMLTMQTDGLIKALRGQTTIAEILRVTAENT